MAKGKAVLVNLPFGIGEMTIVPNDVEQRAAWSLYVELVSRIAVQSLKDDEGLLREALTSLYRLFDVTRAVLKEAGPAVGNGQDSVGAIALRVLNEGLRPFLAKWHPLLKDHEDKRPADVSQRQHEMAWSQHAEMRSALRELQRDMGIYAAALGEIAGIELPLQTTAATGD
jgi:hypothetical protein